MAENTLTVPAQHLELFRLATAEEIGSDATWAKDQAEEMSRKLLSRDAPMTAAMHGPVRHLAATVALMDELDASSPTAVEVHAEATVFAHIAESMAGIVNSRLAAELDVTPLDAERMNCIQPLYDALGWATGTAARFHGIETAEIRTGQAEAR
jgi:hypothetical protein